MSKLNLSDAKLFMFFRFFIFVKVEESQLKRRRHIGLKKCNQIGHPKHIISRYFTRRCLALLATLPRLCVYTINIIICCQNHTFLLRLNN